MRVCSTSWVGGRPAGRVTVGWVSNDPVTLIPVFSTTGRSPEPGALPGGAEPAGELDGGDAGLDPAAGDREPDEQALSTTAAAITRATRVGPPRHRGRATLAIYFHSVVGRP